MSALTLNVYEGTSIEVSLTLALLRTIKNKLSERHLKLNAQTGRSWLQQNARLLTRTTRKLIAATYVSSAIHFPWHNSIASDAASSSVGQLSCS